MQQFISPPLPSPGQLLVLQQSQQISLLLATIREKDSQLSAALAAAAGAGGPREPEDPERRRLRGTSFERYARECYLLGKNHSPGSATAEITRDLSVKLFSCFGRQVLLGEVCDSAIDSFRRYLSAEVEGGKLAAPTANKYLRQLRAICNYAARRKLIENHSPIDFLKEADPEVNSWTPDELSAIERLAAALKGMVGRVPANVFWTAWALVMMKTACRLSAMMLAGREDYSPADRTLLLRAANQKQKRDQRLVLPPRAAEAVERLLAAHDEPRIFGCWPFDPPLKSGRRKWKVLNAHFERLLVGPAGLKLEKGVKSRQFRRTGATLCEAAGGNATELLGHSSPKTTERYKDRRKKRACRQGLCIPDVDPQAALFDKHSSGR